MSKAWNVKTKNIEQKQAIEALLDPQIDLVILSGSAGGGKNYLTLAAGLELVIEQHMYDRILFTRAPVSVGEDLGFLPGTIDEKMAPWCYSVFDNLEALNVDAKDVQRYLEFTAMQHMRGRSFQRKFIVLDETQNITKEQIKVLLTRAGENTKIVCLGDFHQTDNKRLTSENNGLSYLIKKAIGAEFVKHISIPGGVRSRLCAWAGDTL